MDSTTVQALRQIIAQAGLMEAVAERPRQDGSQPRRQQFAIALHRHAKGAKAAAAAWLQEIAHT